MPSQVVQIECSPASTRLRLLAQGTAGEVLVAPDITSDGQRCDPLGLSLELTLEDQKGTPLVLKGNPAVVQLSTQGEPGDLFAWSNWCGHPAARFVIAGRLNIGRGVTARIPSPYFPNCVSPSGPSVLTVLLSSV